MNSRSAPRGATWLLEHVGGRSRLDPLIGDLIEQFEEGRSHLWYWRQAIGSLAIELIRRLRLNALTFTAAVAAGWSLIWLVDAGYPIALQALRGTLAAVSGHPSNAQAVARVVSIVLCDLLVDVLAFIAVWIVVRIHRSNPRAVLCVFAALVTVRYVPNFWHLLIHAVTDSRFAAPLILQHVDLMMPVVWQALYLLAAGLWVVRKSQITRMSLLNYIVAVLAASLYILAEVVRATGFIGELTATPYAQYLFDVLKMTSVGYLVLLLWRLGPHRADPVPNVTYP